MTNAMETFVKEAIEKLTPEYRGMCKCSQCHLDIMAISLNQLPPLYWTSPEGEIYTKLYDTKPQFQADVLKTVASAIEMVMSKPRHYAT